MFRKAKALADAEEPGLIDLDYAEFLADAGRIVLARKRLEKDLSLIIRAEELALTSLSCGYFSRNQVEARRC